MPDGNFVPVLRRSEPKIVYFTLVLFAFFKWFCFLLYRIPFNIDSTERTSRANIFASTTAYANLFIYMGNRQPVFIRHHCDSLRGTVFRAGPTTSSVCITMQFSSIKTTYPICVRCFCFTLIGRIAPLGQTSPQTVQSKLQNPFSKLTVGCITPAKPYSMKAGFSTCDGHLLIQRWHDVHCC